MNSTTRRLRYFVTVAEELHFSRAAQQLFIAQQALSKQIRELENELGTRLLKRTTRSVELTDAGREFLAVCKETLAGFDSGVERVRSIGDGHRGSLSLGFFVLAALELTTPILNEFQERYPHVDIEMREFTFLDPSAGLKDGTSDVAILRLPIAHDDLKTEVLFVEPRVAALAKNHPLAGRKSVRLVELLGDRMTMSRGGDAVYRDYWSFADRRTSPMPDPIETSSHAQELEIVATGQAWSITAACAARFTPHAGVRFVPIEDLEGVACALAWTAESLNPAATTFVEIAKEVRDRESTTVDMIENPTFA